MIILENIFGDNYQKKIMGIACYLVFGLHFAYSQDPDTPASSPSIATFEANVNNPSGLCTGIPTINNALIALPTKSKNVAFNLSVSYHPNNISNQNKASDVGLGWSLLGIGGISKTIIAGADEHSNNWTGNYELDDVYNYNFLGISGKFKFRKYNGQYYINKMSSSAVKITYTNASTNGGLKVSSFTIVDGNGMKYVFDQFDFVNDRQRITGTNGFTRVMSNTYFHLTKIYDDLGNEIASLNYELIHSTSLESFKKIKSITANHMGKLEFEYAATAGFATRNDVGQLNAVRLKNPSGQTVRACKLDYNFLAQQSPDTVRFLTSLNICDSNENPVEKYTFNYDLSGYYNTIDAYGFTSQYPKNGVLYKVTLPTGGHILYNFESNNINQREYQNGEVYFSWAISTLHFEIDNFYPQPESSFSFATPNNPAVNYGENKGGLRIGSILHFDSQNQPVPSKSIYYNYQDFNEPNNSSGQMMVERSLPNEKFQVKVFYKNVKVTEGAGNGYKKYYFYTYTDIPRYSLSSGIPYWEDFMIVKNGLLKYAETYSNDNKLLVQDKYYYTIYNDPYINIDLYFTDDHGGENFYAPYSFITGTYVSSKNFSYNPDKIIENKSISLMDPITRRTSNTVTYDSDNLRNISKFYYTGSFASDPMAVLLLTKNRRNDLLKSETYYENEKISEEKPLYKDWGNGLIAPEFMQASKSNGSLETRDRYTKVDNLNGNLLEIEHENGMKTSYIYGYNKTQKVAKIDNMAYDNIPANLISAIQTASNAVPYNEQSLLTALNSLRTAPALANSMVETYTYKILVGISSVTDAKGDKISYEYDTFGRLKTVRNKSGSILSENEYRYRTQN